MRAECPARLGPLGHALISDHVRLCSTWRSLKIPLTITEAAPETRSFEADVAKLLHLMVHAVYSDKDAFLRELVSNAADACEKLRYEGLSDASLLGDDGEPRITVTLDPESRQLTIEDHGIGMSEAELADALGTIARPGKTLAHL